jgi:cation diffusion facilitator CzcD-associated flavoprotein CzcO
VNVSENEEVELKAKFIIWCTGYFSYEKAFSSVIPGLDDFKGTVAHPQFWPQDLNYADKQVVVIGSGATAITLLPALAKTAAKVTMLQRSPSYVVGVPAITGTTLWLRKWLPKWLAWPLIWTQDFVIEQVFIQFCLKFPNAARKALMSSMKAKLPKPVDVDVHFNPRYPPMDQRLLLCPDDDFFKALHRENTQIVTDTITTVTSDGILTSSGRKIEADVIVTATGEFLLPHFFSLP